MQDLFTLEKRKKKEIKEKKRSGARLCLFHIISKQCKTILLDRDPEHPFFRNRNIPPRISERKTGERYCAYLFRPLCLYFECIDSTGHIYERRIHSFNVIRQCVGEKCNDPAVFAYFRVGFFTVLILNDDPNIYMTFLRNYLCFLLFSIKSDIRFDSSPNPENRF